MDKGRMQRLSECYRLLDEAGDTEACLSRYPDLADDIGAYGTVRRFVLDRLPEGPGPHALVSGRALLSTAARGHSRAGPLGWLSPRRAAGALAGLLLVAGAAAAGAATGGAAVPATINKVLSELGITDDTDRAGPSPTGESPAMNGSPELNASPEASAVAEGGGSATPGSHGDAVSDAVHTAIAATSPGPGRGDAVSDAACDAAHDRSTLPEGAQGAPGQQDRTPSGCDDGQPEITPTATPEPPSAAPGPGRSDQRPSRPR